MGKDDQVEKPVRNVKVKPINSACKYSILPIEELFTDLVQGYCSKMYFMGQFISFWGYTEPVTIDVYREEIDESAGILKRVLEAIKTLHFRNRDSKDKQLKDFGRMIWLLEKGYLYRRDHYCPICSDQTSLRFPDIFEFCGRCGAPLELKKFMPPRFLKHIQSETK